MNKEKQIICLLALAVIINGSRAQEVQELGAGLSAMRASADARIKSEGDRLNSLIYDFQPTLYCINGKFTSTGNQTATRLVTDWSSIQLLKASDIISTAVELFVIKIENPSDVKDSFNLSDLNGFKKLKYVLFQYNFLMCPEQTGKSDCGKEKLQNMISAGTNGPALRILYSAAIDN